MPLGTLQQYLLSDRFQVLAPSGAQAEVGQLGEQMQYLHFDLQWEQIDYLGKRFPSGVALWSGLTALPLVLPSQVLVQDVQLENRRTFGTVFAVNFSVGHSPRVFHS